LRIGNVLRGAHHRIARRGVNKRAASSVIKSRDVRWWWFFFFTAREWHCKRAASRAR